MSTGAEDVERLRRIAYGPDATPQERAAAEASLRELEAQAQAQARELALADEATADGGSVDEPEQVDAVGGTAGESDGTDGSDDGIDGDDDQSVEPSLWGRRIRVGWLIPIAVGAVLLGAVATVGGTGLFDPEAQLETPMPAPTAINSMVDTNIVGNLDAADTWFAIPFQASDTFPEPSQLASYGIGEHDIRLALDGGDLGSAWVGHTLGKLCLIIADSAGGRSAANCLERNWFTTQGVSIGMGGLSATWYGSQVISIPPIDPMPRVSPSGKR